MQTFFINNQIQLRIGDTDVKFRFSTPAHFRLIMSALKWCIRKVLLDSFLFSLKILSNQDGQRWKIHPKRTSIYFIRLSRFTFRPFLKSNCSSCLSYLVACNRLIVKSIPKIDFVSTNYSLCPVLLFKIDKIDYWSAIWMTAFPKFLPWKIPTSASAAFSNPFVTSSLTLSSPFAIHWGTFE